MTRHWLWGGLAILAAILIISFQMRNSSTSSRAPSPSDDVITDTRDDEAALPAARLSPGARAPVAESDTPSPPPADPKFQEWIREEAKSLDYPSVDSERKRAEIQKILKEITPTQSRQLLQTARHPHSGSGEKILSTYLMVEGGINTRQELLDFLKDEPSAQGEAHTIDEINGVRDRSLRIMAIDGLFSQAQRDHGAHAALVREISSIQDPYVKAYAQRKLEELGRTQHQ